ncbi:MAG: phytanoyl-CoA dioxygenase family protein, partial [Candidatus Competibacterales bacterium]|nr:phytanoyl-CoA dioxygenase family protein [Candidatus Competibacterales bacterium]
MNYSAIDPYPSRLSREPGIVNRQDPVVHGEGDLPATLSREQIEAYRNDGFLLLPELLDSREIEAVSAEMQRMGKDEAIGGLPEAVRETANNTLRTIYRAHELSELFGRLARDERLLDTARYLLGDEVYLHQSRANLRPPFQGTDFQWHSDFETWHTEDGMPRMRALSMMLYLADNTDA